jgi:hypothetical protein
MHTPLRCLLSAALIARKSVQVDLLFLRWEPNRRDGQLGWRECPSGPLDAESITFAFLFSAVNEVGKHRPVMKPEGSNQTLPEGRRRCPEPAGRERLPSLRLPVLFPERLPAAAPPAERGWPSREPAERGA